MMFISNWQGIEPEKQGIQGGERKLSIQWQGRAAGWAERRNHERELCKWNTLTGLENVCVWASPECGQ